MREMAARLRAAGCREWFLNVKPDNEPALRLYRSFGMERSHGSVALRLEWQDVARLPQHPAPELVCEDALLETAFALLPGQVASLRQRGFVLLALGRAGAPAAFAAFNPDYPGAHPFRVREVAWARPLLEAMREHARPEHSFVGLLAENHPALAEALQAAGATVRFAIEQLRGPLPEGG
jgi:hypothetical protein